MGIKAESERAAAEAKDLADRRKAWEDSQQPKAPPPATIKTTAPPPPANAAAPSPPEASSSSATPDANSSSLDWAKYYLTPSSYHNLPSSQQIGDFRTIYSSDTPYREAFKRATGQPVDFVGLKAQADAARARLGPAGSAAADFVGNTINPVNALSMIPFAGPSLAGAAQNGLQSYGHGESGADVALNTGLGLGLGTASKLAVTPSFLRQAGGEAVQRGPTALAGYLFGGPFGHGWEGATGGALLGGLDTGLARAGNYVRSIGTGAEGWAANSAWPAARNAMQQLLYGNAMTAGQGNAQPFLPGP